MQHPFTSLAPEYTQLLSIMQVLPERQREINAVATHLFSLKSRYVEVSQATGIPVAFIAASFEREASSNFVLSPAQGDRWDRVSVHVPKGRGPFRNWTEAALDAYHIDALDTIGAANWSMARACYEGELFNGFGYRGHSVHTPYLWAGTTVYTRGKYTSDGNFDSFAKDQQLGMIPVMLRMAELDPSLALRPSGLLAIAAPPLAPQPAPAGVGGGSHDAAWVQHALNRLHFGPLVEDGHYGRRTAAAVRAFQDKNNLEVDGLAGPRTVAALAAAA